MHDTIKNQMARERQTIADLAAAVGQAPQPNGAQQAAPDVEPGEDTSPPASDKQLHYLAQLLDKGLLADGKAEAIREQMADMTMARASRYIDRLVELRGPEFRFAKVGEQWVVKAPADTDAQPGDEVEVTKRNGSTTVTLGARMDADGEVLFGIKRNERQADQQVALRDDVPAGRYAITGEDGTTDFYKVDRPTEGRWAGRVFVKLLVAHGGYGDDLAEQRVGYAQTAGVLDRIAEAGVQEAMERYGRELGHCGHCGRTLTNAESIERGIGPVCAGKMGWS